MTLSVKHQKKETPLMEQYNSIKEKHPDAILLFRVGDFYESFGEDAIITSKILNIVLTARNNGASKKELAGFPYHALDTYLPKLVRAGYRVAICEQLEDPKMVKGIVKRGVTELVTPGVSYNDLVLENKSNNFLASVVYGTTCVGAAFLDVSTGEFLLAEGNQEYIDKLLQSFSPTEVIFQKDRKKEFSADFHGHFFTFSLDSWVFGADYATDLLIKQFDTKNLKGFGIDQCETGKIAAGSILHYLKETEHHHTQHISSIRRIEQEKYVWMDRFTMRNLELFNSTNEGAKTLLDILDDTISPMGARLLKRWIAFPLQDLELIERRLSVVGSFLQNEMIRTCLSEEIKIIGDLERIISKVATARISPRECNQLKIAIQSLAPIQEAMMQSSEVVLQEMASEIFLCKELLTVLENNLHPDPPILLSKGNIIKEGVSQELDALRSIATKGKTILDEILQKESKRTGIPSLKISFNNVFGYYLEVRNTHQNKVPTDWIRKQTLVNAERYITEELKEYEQKIITAEDRIIQLEQSLFQQLVEEVKKYILPIQQSAMVIANLDVLLSFSKLSEKYNYVKPTIERTERLLIKDGRHPVIERLLKADDVFVPNSVQLDKEQQQIIIITGPNMSGKSALLRQTALIVLMAQIGCFVPAAAAHIGIVDKIFTRVGASDNISQGESTFMVEMTETASILNNLSERSLVLLDEIGRGTSTYDGVSIAWAIAEYLHEHAAKPKTLFATHYHELNEMANLFERIKNYNVAVKEIDGRIIFIRKLQEGGSEHSFGIHVAKMAGIPKKIVNRANEVLQQLENTHSGEKLTEKTKKISRSESAQLSFFQLDDPTLIQIRNEISELDINTLTPIEALMKLHEIKKHIGEK